MALSPEPGMRSEMAINLPYKRIIISMLDFLDFDNLPDTNFSCIGKVIGGYYADLETNCQMFHVCTIGQLEEPMDIRFLCLNGTVFDQETRVCERIDEVDCSKSEQFYGLNLELYGNTQPPILEESHETEAPIIIKPSSTTSTTTTSTTTTTPRPKPKTTGLSFFSTSAQPQVTVPSNPRVISSHHFPVIHTNSPDIRFNPAEINISLNPGARPDIRTKPVSFQEHSFSDSSSSNNKRVIVTTHTTVHKSENKPNRPQETTSVERPKVFHSTSKPTTVTPSDINFSFAYQNDEDGYHTEHPSHNYQYELNLSNLRPPNLAFLQRHPDNQHVSTHRSDSVSSTGKYNFDDNSNHSPTTYRSQFHPLLKTTQHYDFHGDAQTEKPHRLQLPLPSLPTLTPLTFSTPAPFTLTRHIDAKRFTNDHHEPPRIIISASASVSDASGRRLNYSLGTIGTAHLLGTPPPSYDEYKDDDVGLDPFYHDVPKLKGTRRKRDVEKRLKPTDIIRTEQEAVDVLKFLFDWYKEHESQQEVQNNGATTITIPVTPEIITEINTELSSTLEKVSDTRGNENENQGASTEAQSEIISQFNTEINTEVSSRVDVRRGSKHTRSRHRKPNSIVTMTNNNKTNESTSKPRVLDYYKTPEHSTLPSKNAKASENTGEQNSSKQHSAANHQEITNELNILSSNEPTTPNYEGNSIKYVHNKKMRDGAYLPLESDNVDFTHSALFKRRSKFNIVGDVIAVTDEVHKNNASDSIRKEPLTTTFTPPTDIEWEEYVDDNYEPSTYKAVDRKPINDDKTSVVRLVQERITENSGSQALGGTDIPSTENTNHYQNGELTKNSSSSSIPLYDYVDDNYEPLIYNEHAILTPMTNAEIGVVQLNEEEITESSTSQAPGSTDVPRTENTNHRQNSNNSDVAQNDELTKNSSSTSIPLYDYVDDNYERSTYKEDATRKPMNDEKIAAVQLNEEKIKENVESQANNSHVAQNGELSKNSSSSAIPLYDYVDDNYERSTYKEHATRKPLNDEKIAAVQLNEEKIKENVESQANNSDVAQNVELSKNVSSSSIPLYDYVDDNYERSTFKEHATRKPLDDEETALNEDKIRENFKSQARRGSDIPSIVNTSDQQNTYNSKLAQNDELTKNETFPPIPLYDYVNDNYEPLTYKEHTIRKPMTSERTAVVQVNEDKITENSRSQVQRGTDIPSTVNTNAEQNSDNTKLAPNGELTKNEFPSSTSLNDYVDDNYEPLTYKEYTPLFSEDEDQLDKILSAKNNSRLQTTHKNSDPHHPMNEKYETTKNNTSINDKMQSIDSVHGNYEPLTNEDTASYQRDQTAQKPSVQAGEEHDRVYKNGKITTQQVKYDTFDKPVLSSAYDEIYVTESATLSSFEIPSTASEHIDDSYEAHTIPYDQSDKKTHIKHNSGDTTEKHQHEMVNATSRAQLSWLLKNSSINHENQNMTLDYVDRKDKPTIARIDIPSRNYSKLSDKDTTEKNSRETNGVLTPKPEFDGDNVVNKYIGDHSGNNAYIESFTTEGTLSTYDYINDNLESQDNRADGFRYANNNYNRENLNLDSTDSSHSNQRGRNRGRVRFSDYSDDGQYLSSRENHSRKANTHSRINNERRRSRGRNRQKPIPSSNDRQHNAETQQNVRRRNRGRTPIRENQSTADPNEQTDAPVTENSFESKSNRSRTSQKHKYIIRDHLTNETDIDYENMSLQKEVAVNKTRNSMRNSHSSEELSLENMSLQKMQISDVKDNTEDTSTEEMGYENISLHREDNLGSTANVSESVTIPTPTSETFILTTTISDYDDHFHHTTNINSKPSTANGIQEDEAATDLTPSTTSYQAGIIRQQFNYNAGESVNKKLPTLQEIISLNSRETYENEFVKPPVFDDNSEHTTDNVKPHKQGSTNYVLLIYKPKNDTETVSTTPIPSLFKKTPHERSSNVINDPSPIRRSDVIDEYPNANNLNREKSSDRRYPGNSRRRYKEGNRNRKTYTNDLLNNLERAFYKHFNGETISEPVRNNVSKARSIGESQNSNNFNSGSEYYGKVTEHRHFNEKGRTLNHPRQDSNKDKANRTTDENVNFNEYAPTPSLYQLLLLEQLNKLNSKNYTDENSIRDFTSSVVTSENYVEKLLNSSNEILRNITSDHARKDNGGNNLESNSKINHTTTPDESYSDTPYFTTDDPRRRSRNRGRTRGSRKYFLHFDSSTKRPNRERQRITTEHATPLTTSTEATFTSPAKITIFSATEANSQYVKTEASPSALGNSDWESSDSSTTSERPEEVTAVREDTSTVEPTTLEISRADLNYFTFTSTKQEDFTTPTPPSAYALDMNNKLHEENENVELNSDIDYINKTKNDDEQSTTYVNTENESRKEDNGQWNLYNIHRNEDSSTISPTDELHTVNFLTTLLAYQNTERTFVTPTLRDTTLTGVPEGTTYATTTQQVDEIETTTNSGEQHTLSTTESLDSVTHENMETTYFTTTPSSGTREIFEETTFGTTAGAPSFAVTAFTNSQEKLITTTQNPFDITLAQNNIASTNFQEELTVTTEQPIETTDHDITPSTNPQERQISTTEKSIEITTFQQPRNPEESWSTATTTPESRTWHSETPTTETTQTVPVVDITTSRNVEDLTEKLSEKLQELIENVESNTKSIAAVKLSTPPAPPTVATQPPTVEQSSLTSVEVTTAAISSSAPENPQSRRSRVRGRGRNRFYSNGPAEESREADDLARSSTHRFGTDSFSTHANDIEGDRRTPNVVRRNRYGTGEESVPMARTRGRKQPHSKDVSTLRRDNAANIPSTDATLSKSASPTRDGTRPRMHTTPVILRRRKVISNYIFNCFGKEINRFYSDPRDCRLFHYCTQGYTKNQLLDMKFVCDLNTYFDEKKLICTKEKPLRCL